MERGKRSLYVCVFYIYLYIYIDIYIDTYPGVEDGDSLLLCLVNAEVDSED